MVSSIFSWFPRFFRVLYQTICHFFKKILSSFATFSTIENKASPQILPYSPPRRLASGPMQGAGRQTKTHSALSASSA
jgi:hypothetical protein